MNQYQSELEVIPGDIVKCTWINDDVSEYYTVVNPSTGIYEDILVVDSNGVFFFLIRNAIVQKHIRMEIL